MNKKKFIAFWDEAQRMKRKKKNLDFTKQDSEYCVELLIKIGQEFGIDMYLFENGSNATIPQSKTMRLDALKETLWRLIQAN